MRDFASCFGESAVNVASTPCSSNSTSGAGAVLSTRNGVTCFYKVILSNEKRLLIRVSWSKNQNSQGLTIQFGNDPATPSFKLSTNSGIFRKKKGSKYLEADGVRFEVIYDLSNARYDAGPEPVGGFFVVVMVESEIALTLGEFGEETLCRRLKHSSIPISQASLISRQEHCSGSTLCSTKATFSDTGMQHDILIQCSAEGGPVLSVYIDKKVVITIKSLQWNFRGNQTLYVDGLLVDLFWDVHDWIFSSSKGCAVFMFKPRTGIDSRLWLEEKHTKKDNERTEFSLVIYACKAS